jgi:hypothetical protein
LGKIHQLQMIERLVGTIDPEWKSHFSQSVVHLTQTFGGDALFLIWLYRPNQRNNIYGKLKF